MSPTLATYICVGPFTATHKEDNTRDSKRTEKAPANTLTGDDNVRKERKKKRRAMTRPRTPDRPPDTKEAPKQKKWDEPTDLQQNTSTATNRNRTKKASRENQQFQPKALTLHTAAAREGWPQTSMEYAR